MDETYTLLTQVIMTKVSHDLAGVIGSAQMTAQLLQEDKTFLNEGAPLLKQSLDVVATRLKFFRALFGLANKPIPPELPQAYLDTLTPKITFEGTLQTPLQSALFLWGSEMLIFGGTILVDHQKVCITGKNIRTDMTLLKNVTQPELPTSFFKPQMAAALWARALLLEKKNILKIDQVPDCVTFYFM